MEVPGIKQQAVRLLVLYGDVDIKLIVLKIGSSCFRNLSQNRWVVACKTTRLCLTVPWMGNRASN